MSPGGRSVARRGSWLPDPRGGLIPFAIEVVIVLALGVVALVFALVAVWVA